MKTFYICSYGGSGSYMLKRALQKYGKIEHVHSRNPPDKLEYIGNKGGGNCYYEWFNGKKIPEEKIKNYYVIFIYKNPINSIYSRYWNPEHLLHVQTNTNTKLSDVISQMKDLYQIEEFYDNYTKPNNNRNYKIICVKYEDIFEKQNELSKYLGIGPLNIIKRETKRKKNKNDIEKLNIIYKNLLEKINKNDFIFIN